MSAIVLAAIGGVILGLSWLVLLVAVSGVHFHHDPDWKIRGAYAYHQCRCGARRVHRAYVNRSGPVDEGWPRPEQTIYSLEDTGWVK